MKNKNYISWDQYFMGLAKLSAKRSKDPNTQVGACIINPDKRIVAIGYNGLPRGLSDDDNYWQTHEQYSKSKYAYVVHAEANAILNATTSLKNATLYVTLFPCNECMKLIVQAGIKEVVYMSDKYNGQENQIASKKMMHEAGISSRQMKLETITLENEFEI